MVSRGSRRRSAIGALAVSVLVLAGCSHPDNSPDAYGDQAREEFVNACTGDVLATAEKEADRTTDVVLPPADTCVCLYEYFVANVPYDDTQLEDDPAFADYGGATFEALDKATDSEPGKVPTELQLALDACSSAPVAPPTSAAGADEG